MRQKDYVFQLTKEDLREIANATNPKPGFCIRIDKSSDGITIGIDENALALAINGFIRNGGGNASSAECTKISFNPPS